MMVFLEDILKKDDFALEADKLGQPFVREQGLGRVHQLGLVTADAEAAATRLEKKGTPPFFLASGPVAMWTENGKDREFKGKLGLAYYCGKELELLEPGVGSNFYRQSLDPGGGIVVQHLGFLVDDVDEWSEKLTAAKCPLWVRGRIKAGPATAEFAYMDARERCGFIIEFISHRFLGIRNTPPGRLFHLMGKMQKLTGKRTFVRK